MPRHTVEMLLLQRGHVKDQRSIERLASLLGDDATVGEPDERRVFEIEIESDDIEQARHRVWNTVAVSGTTDNIKLLEHPDLPEQWLPMAGPARG
ncbi:MAG: hypothetical protein QOD69_2423 [Solirubrobacteraceae bacterium]|nr:hypothetical protein [Solirubrobacteraceae bacterium]